MFPHLAREQALELWAEGAGPGHQQSITIDGGVFQMCYEYLPLYSDVFSLYILSTIMMYSTSYYL